jgi:hypothetical protein
MNENDVRARRGIATLARYRELYGVHGRNRAEMARDLIADLYHGLDALGEPSDEVSEFVWDQYLGEVDEDGGRARPVDGDGCCEGCGWPLLYDDAQGDGRVCRVCQRSEDRRETTEIPAVRGRRVVRAARSAALYGGLVVVGAVGWLALSGR